MEKEGIDMQGRLESELRSQSRANTIISSFPDYVKEWYYYLSTLDMTTDSCITYLSKVKQFLIYLNEDFKEVAVEQITEQAVRSFMIAIQLRTRSDGMIVFTSDSTLSTFWCVLNNFLDFLVSKDYIPENYIKKIPRKQNNDIERVSKERVWLTQKDFRKIMKSVKNGETFKTQTREYLINRNCVVFLLLMTLGLTEKMVSEINVCDINFSDNSLTIVGRKNKISQYTLTDDTMEYLEKWMQDRVNLGIQDAEPLFTDKNGKRLSVVGITRLVEKYTKLALGKELTPHTIRAGFCSILYEETKDANFVKNAIGFRNLESAKRYTVNKNDEKKIASQIISQKL